MTLPPVAGSEFSGSTLPAGWQVTPWSVTDAGTAAVGGGVLAVDGAQTGTDTLYGPGRTLEFVATFTGDPFQHTGFAVDFTDATPYAIFSTGAGGGVYARTSDGVGGVMDTLLPGVALGAAHDFRIDWAADGITYWVDGAQVAYHPIAVTSALRPLVGDFGQGGGQVVVDSMTLIPPGDETTFDGTSLPAGWHSSVQAHATVALGTLTVDGGAVGTDAAYGPGRTLEFAGAFSGDPFQHVGFGVDFTGTTPYAIFSTGAGGGVYARTSDGVGGVMDTLLPGVALGAAHDFRIDWAAGGVTYWVDGAQVAYHPISVGTSLRALASDFQTGGGVLTVDWLRVSPFDSAGTYVSRVFDAGTPVSWVAAAADADAPAGTVAAVVVRTGNTPTPDATWTEFAPLTSADAGTYRYAQYRLDLSTTDPDRTPVVRGVTLTTGTPGLVFADTTAADFAAGTPGTGILADDGPAANAPFTAVLVTGPAHGALDLRPDGSFTYTPTAGYRGADSFVYRARGDDGTLYEPRTVTFDVYAAAGHDTPTLTVADAAGAEGSAIPLVISAGLAVSDLSETLSVTISGLPAGATLSRGTVTGGVWTLAPTDLAGLTFTAPDNGTFALTVTATARTTATGATSSASAVLTVTVGNAAPTAAISTTGPVTYGTATAVQLAGATDPSAADAAAGLRYAFALDPAALAGATYATSGSSPTAAFALTAGTHTVYARVIDKDGGYTPYQIGVTVNKAALAVVAAAKSKVYGAALPALTYSATGFVNGDTAAVLTGAPATTAAAASGVGNYPISAGSLAAANYAITFTGATLAVTRAPLVVTANSLSMSLGGPLPTLTASYSGFVNGDTAASLTTPPTLTTTATAASPIGSYTITAAGAAGANYAITYVSGTLTVTAPTRGTAYVAPDPIKPGANALFVSGTAAADQIVIGKLDLFGSTAVLVHISTSGAPGGGDDFIFYGQYSRIVVRGQAGNDDIWALGPSNLATWAYGDDGDDRLMGGIDNSVLIGGNGADLLVGGTGRDLLIGDLGADRIIGGGGDDILIGGTTAYDGNETALSALMGVWVSNDSFSTRVAKLTSTAAQYHLVQGVTVFNDTSVDQFTGGGGSDWFFAGRADQLTDLSSSDRAFIAGP